MTVLDMEVMRQFYSDMAKADEVTFDPDMTHDELAQSIASTSGIDNQEELAAVLFDTAIRGAVHAAFLQGKGFSTAMRAVAHVAFELGYKMGLHASTQKPD